MNLICKYVTEMIGRKTVLDAHIMDILRFDHQISGFLFIKVWDLTSKDHIFLKLWSEGVPTCVHILKCNLQFYYGGVGVGYQVIILDQKSGG